MALSDQLAVPNVRLRPGLFDPAVVELIDRDTARRLKVLPLFRVRGLVSLATAQPQAIQLRYLQTLTDISSEKNSQTIVFPMPIKILEGLANLGKSGE